jgi:hypothetical protein
VGFSVKNAEKALVYYPLVAPLAINKPFGETNGEENAGG